ncbi:MAG: VIT1/CCC1 transporter family protein [Candidatus Micrarchaeota archaeon]
MKTSTKQPKLARANPPTNSIKAGPSLNSFHHPPISLKDMHHAGELHKPSKQGSDLRDFILGGQDGLVNVMGIVLGVASATNDVKIVLIAGLVATFAESISMAAVAYTSTQAEKSYYESLVEKEEKEMREIPEMEVSEIRDIYYNWGFRGKLLDDVVNKITSDKKVWLEVMLRQELNTDTDPKADPVHSGIVVGAASFVGSIIPLIPFVLLPVGLAMWAALIMGILVLFAGGAYKARVTTGSWWKSGLEIAVIGTTAAIAGYLIGSWLGANPLLSG